MADSTLTARSFVSRYFSVDFDGDDSSGFVKSIDGGGIRSDLVTQAVGGQAMTNKHLGKVSIEPFTIQVGMSMSSSFFDWIAKSWSGDVERKNGSVLTYDRNFNVVHEQEFKEALVLETTIPALDAASKDGSAYMTVKFQAESSKHKMNPEMKRVKGKTPAKQKLWSPQNFRFEVDGLDVKRVSKIESFTVKQSVKQLATGPDRIRSDRADQARVSESHGLGHDVRRQAVDRLARGLRNLRQIRAGKGKDRLDHLDGPRAQGNELLTIKLKGVGITGLTLDKGDTATDAIKKVKIELYVEEYEFDFGDDKKDDGGGDKPEPTPTRTTTRATTSPPAATTRRTASASTSQVSAPSTPDRMA